MSNERERDARVEAAAKALATGVGLGEWSTWGEDWKQAWRDKARAVLAAADAAQGAVQGNWHRHHVVVGAAALQMVRNALRRDAKEGKQSRGEMLEELDKVTQPLELARAASSPLSTERGWIPVSERMPAQGRKVLCAVPAGPRRKEVGMIVLTACHPEPGVHDDDEFGWFDAWGNEFAHPVTHWMPLPAAPTGDTHE